MPDGRTHAKLTTATTIGLLALGATFRVPVVAVSSLAAGSLFTLWVNPDLDQAESHPGLFNMLWWPYGILIPHRSWLSHTPIIGTLLRCLYMGLAIAVLVVLIEVHFDYQITVPVWSGLGWAVLGMTASDTVHCVIDNLDTRRKKWFRK